MKKKIFILLIAIILFIFLIIFNKETKEYYKEFNYFDSNIYIKIYTNSDKKADDIFNEIDNIYNEYDILCDKKKSYENINNLHYILNNTSDLEFIELDQKLYSILEYGIEVYSDTDGVIDISKGSIIDLWDSYLITKYGVPSNSEINLVNNFSIEDLILKDGKIYNNNININLDYIINGYMNNIIKEHLNDIGIDNYVINMDNSIVVGDKLKEDYKIALEDPNDLNNIIEVVETENKAITTVGGYKNNYIWNNKSYNYLINSKTNYSSNYMQSITVISDDSKESYMLANYLYLLPIKEGKKIVSEINNIEVIWYDNNNKITRNV